MASSRRRARIHRYASNAVHIQANILTCAQEHAFTSEHIIETHTTSATNYDNNTNTTTHYITDDNQRILGAEELSNLSDNMDDYEARLDARGDVSEHPLIGIN